MTPLISIIICTYNRATILADTVDSFYKMNLPDISKHEIIIVNNNSNDDTEVIIADRMKKYGASLKYVFEPKAGLSYARNRGISDSCGQIVAFVDDDTFFDIQWLKNILEGFHQYPDCAAIGGKVEVHFDTERPCWLNDERLEHCGFASTKLGNHVKALKFPEYPFGSNMAFRRSALMAVGNFSVNLGRTPNSLLSNEETEFFYRLEKLNLKTLYIPNAIVFCRIPKSRLTRQWFISRFYWQGVSNAVMKNNLSKPKKMELLKQSTSCIQNIFIELVGKKIHPIKFLRHVLNFRFERIVIIALHFGFLKQTVKFLLMGERDRL